MTGWLLKETWDNGKTLAHVSQQVADLSGDVTAHNVAVDQQLGNIQADVTSHSIQIAGEMQELKDVEARISDIPGPKTIVEPPPVIVTRPRVVAPPNPVEALGHLLGLRARGRQSSHRVR